MADNLSYIDSNEKKYYLINCKSTFLIAPNNKYDMIYPSLFPSFLFPYIYLASFFNLEQQDQESNVYFVQFNLFSDYFLALRQSSDFYVRELEDRTDSQTDVVAVIVSAVSLVLTILILIPVLMVVNSTREEVLGLFLDIPEKTVKYLYSKCENFISNIQIGEEDEVASLDDLDRHNGEGAGGPDEVEEQFRQRRRRKKFKNSTMS